MSLQDIASLGKMLAQFLTLFDDCFHGVKGRRMLAAYVRGLLSGLQRKNVEAIALMQGFRPRTRVGRQKKSPRLAAGDAKACEVRHLAKYSPGLAEQTPQRYRVRDSHKGPEIWEVRWHVCYRKTHDGRLVSSQCTLIITTNVRTEEVKYFVSNRVPGRRGWGCVHRHLIVTILTQLFCACVRHRLCPSEVVTEAERLTLEQVRRGADVFIRCMHLPRRIRLQEYKAELERIHYHQSRNAQASRCHRKRRLATYQEMGIDPNKIKSVDPKTS